MNVKFSCQCRFDIRMLSMSLALAAVCGLSTPMAVAAETDDTAAASSTLPLDELRTFTDVLDRIKRDYVEDIDDKTLLENAIRGMLSGLDPHSSYLDGTMFRELQTGTSGEFGGLGIEVGVEDGFIRVITPIDDTPAQRAGVQAGDLIVRLDDTPVQGLSLNDAVKLMRGKPGSEIVLTIVREGEGEPLKITIEREVIQVSSVRQRMLAPGFGYARITQFQSRTARYLSDAIDDLDGDDGEPLLGFILDLRNNPGGVLNAAVEVSDIFLEEGSVVYTEGRSGGSRQDFKASPGDELAGAPLVVLVNGGSASASEIVAGALQDHRRAIIIGEPTFGKGSVQTILPLSNGTAVKLTTARYYTPDGRSIQAEGIKPDIKVARLKLSAEELVGLGQVKEADLSRHLENDRNGEIEVEADTADDDADVASEDDPADSSKPEAETPKLPSIETLARSDYQLYEALILLKGLALMQNRG